jgi:hypothetical protein
VRSARRFQAGLPLILFHWLSSLFAASSPASRHLFRAGGSTPAAYAYAPHVLEALRVKSIRR